MQPEPSSVVEHHLDDRALTVALLRERLNLRVHPLEEIFD
jgi:hypothetical protein